MAQAGTVVEAERGAPGHAEVGGEVKALSHWGLFWRRFRRDRVAIAGAVLILEIAILAIIAPLLAHLVGHGPNSLYQSELTTTVALPKGPSSTFWFGADQVGRDVFVRTMYGARTSLMVAVSATVFATVIGALFGMISGYFGGKTDTVLSRFIDIFLSLPYLLFAIGLASVCSVTATGCFGFLQPGVPLVIAILAIFTWAYLARIVRGQVLSLKEREFIQAARAMGASDRRIIFSELLPNLVAPITVYATLIIPSNILFAAALSFLGVGIPQTTPSWGRMLSDATSNSLFTYAWWMMVFPGIFLLFTTLAFNLVGDGLRDALDPRGGRR